MNGAAELRPGCKINLRLRILGRRPDGYHELETLFYPLPEPTDRILVRPGSAGAGLEFTCSVPELAGPENLVARAYRDFATASGFTPDLALHLDKRTPVGAGLGGGSADAASVLLHLNRLAGPLAVPQARLAELALGLGADVPFFLLGQPALARGVGERLLPVPEVDRRLEGCWLLLCTPEVRVSTAWAYRAWDEANPDAVTEMPESGDGRVSDTLTASPGEAIEPLCPKAPMLVNSFEAVVFPKHPELRRIKELLLDTGAAAALLSGSGSSLFGLYRTQADARRGQEVVSARKVATYLHKFGTGVSPSW